MFERELTIYAFLLHYARRLTADIDDEKFAEVPSPGVNHPAWLIGHMAISTDFAAGLFRERIACPKAWHRLFGPGTSALPDRALYPSKAELMTALENGHDRVVAVVKEAEPISLAEPHALAIADFSTFLPTKADLLTHLLTSHEAGHLGHLSNWRRQMGMKHLF